MGAGGVIPPPATYFDKVSDRAFFLKCFVFLILHFVVKICKKNKNTADSSCCKEVRYSFHCWWGNFVILLQYMDKLLALVFYGIGVHRFYCLMLLILGDMCIWKAWNNVWLWQVQHKTRPGICCQGKLNLVNKCPIW